MRHSWDEYVTHTSALVPQASFTTALSSRWATCVQVRCLRSQMPPCMWRDRSWLWPGTHWIGLIARFWLIADEHLRCSLQRLAERLQEGYQERRERALLVHSPQRHRPHRRRRDGLHCSQPFLEPPRLPDVVLLPPGLTQSPGCTPSQVRCQHLICNWNNVRAFARFISEQITNKDAFVSTTKPNKCLLISLFLLPRWSNNTTFNMMVCRKPFSKFKKRKTIPNCNI